MDKNSWGGMLIILGLIFIFASHSELDGPTSGRSLTDDERDYWAPKCIDWLSDDHPYWMSDGSNMCFEYEKGWDYTTVAIGVLMIIGGIACFLDFSQIGSTNEKITDSHMNVSLDEELKKLEGELNQTDESIDNEPKIKKEKAIQKFSSGIKTKKEKPKEKMNNNLVNELKKLNELKEQGILDDEEFKSAKRKIIEKQ